MRPEKYQSLTLAFLRVTCGFLLIWWGLAKGLSLGVGRAVSDNFYGGLFSVDTLLVAFGWFEVALGAAVVLGYARRYVLPAQLAINAFTAAAVWYAIIDPFKLYLPPQSSFPFTQLFYPSIIVVAANCVLIAFRPADTLALDAPDQLAAAREKR